uniref:Uncharacterized protein n=1 Tax=Ditylenchus dipsaci TaxID=166011 RepID=A0A915E6I5_9BILA
MQLGLVTLEAYCIYVMEVGRRFTFAVCRKADVNIDRKTSRMARTHKLVLSKNLESKYRDEFEHMKKIHYWVSAFVDSTPRLLVARVALLESPRRRVAKKIPVIL